MKGTLIMKKKKQKILILLSIVAVIAIAISTYSFLSSKDEKEAIVNEIYEQFELKKSEEELNNQSGIILESTNFIKEFNTSFGKKVDIKVENIKGKEAILKITSPDLFTILSQNGEERYILESLKDKNCPYIENKVTITFESIDGEININENTELINAIYGNALKYFEEKGM